MLRRFTGSFITLLLILFTTGETLAQKFPFPQQGTYAHGILPQGVSYRHIQTIYDIWLNAYYEEQGNQARIKFDTPSQTVSEGIGYGMLILVYMDNDQNNTKPKFDKLWNYYKNYPSKGSLMHWKINGFGGVQESGSATDGDIDVALALIMAAEQWEDNTYLNAAETIIRDIASYDVSNNLLDGGDSWDAVNPSYMSMVATELFKDIDPSHNWSTIQSSCYSHLKSTQHGTTGMWPNWTSGGVGNTGLYGFDAARTPWRLGWAYAWYGHADAKTCCDKIVGWFKSNTQNNPGKIGQIYNLDGSINSGAGGNNDNIPTFLAPLVVAGMVSSEHSQWLDDGYKRLRAFGSSDDKYYNECIELLTMLLLSGNMPDFTTAQPRTSAKLTVSVSPQEAGTVTISNPQSSYPLNTQLTLTAVSSDPQRYSFVGWSGDYEGSGATANIKIICDMTITATFKDNQAMDLVDDCEDGNAKTFLKTSWFTFNDSTSGGKSTVTPKTSSKTPFQMVEGGFESEYAAKITYSLDKGNFSGDPFVGVGFSMSTKNDPVDISEATGIRFYYKGNFGDTTCGLRIESESVTEAGANYNYFLAPNSSWEEVSLVWNDFQQPKWTKNPVPLDLTTIKKFQWQIQGPSGSSGELWLDEIHLLDYYIERPLAAALRRGYAGKANNLIECMRSSGQITVNFTTNASGNVNLSLYDLTGRLVRQLVSGRMSAGTHAVPIFSTLSNSGYVVRLSTENGSHTAPLIVTGE